MISTRTGPPVVVLVVAIAVLLAGCSGPAATGSPADTTDTEGTDAPTATSESTPTETVTPTRETPSDTPGVAVASDFVRVQGGETERLNYRGRNVTVTYTRSNGTSRVEVEMEDDRKIITNSATDSGEMVSWSWGDLRLHVTPVTAEQRNGQTVYTAGETWNTSHVELEVYCTQDC